MESKTDCWFLLAQVQKEAVQSVEQDGMVFIDEIDKIVVNHDSRYGMLRHGTTLLAASPRQSLSKVSDKARFLTALSSVSVVAARRSIC